MKRLTIVWIIFAVIMFGGLATLGILFVNNQKNEYSFLEERLADAARQYGEATFIYNNIIDYVEITSDELIKKGFLEDLNFNGEECQGYVRITKAGVFKYEGFVKCEGYTTRGY